MEISKSERKPRGYWTVETVSVEAKKWDGKSQFEKGNKNAYQAGLKLKILDKLFVNKLRSWDRESLIVEMGKYSSKQEFQRKDGSAYQTARRHYKGLLDEMYENKIKKSGYWSEENIRKHASECKTIVEFSKKYPTAYSLALKLNIVDELFTKTLKYWDESSIRKEAKLYDYAGEMQKGSPGAYGAAWKRFPGLIQELFDKKSFLIWDEKNIRKEAKKYKYKSDMSAGSSSAYSAAVSRYPGLIDELFENKIIPWNEKTIREEAKKYTWLSEFSKGSPGAYSAALTRYPGLVNKLLANKFKPSGYWTEQKIREKAKNFETKVAFKNKYCHAYERARELGIIDELFDNKLKYWDEKSITEEAKNYRSKVDFSKRCSSAYNAALRLGIINELFDNLYNPSGYWTKERVIEEAKKYKTKMDFKNGTPAAYSTSIRKYPDVIDDCFQQNYPNKPSNVIYLWGDADGSDIYKIGITGEHLKDERIKWVARDANINPEIIRISKVENAPKLEKILLKIGIPFDFGKTFHGCTEFRRLTVKELNKVISIIDQETIFDFEYVKKTINAEWKGREYSLKQCSIFDFERRIRVRRNPPGHWTKEKIVTFAKDYSNRTELAKASSPAYKSAIKLGIIDEILPTNKRKWDEESVRAEAKKYKSKAEFQRGCQPACTKARKMGIINELFSNITKPNGYWTTDRVIRESYKYNTKSEFYRKCPSAYGIACRNRLICKFSFGYKKWDKTIGQVTA